MENVKPPALFYTHYRKLYLTYRSRYYRNIVRGVEYHGWEEWAIFVGFDTDKWFGTNNFYYDGHTSKIFYFLGLTVGKLYTYSLDIYNNE